MGYRPKSRKRPCRICRKWFCPDPRVGERQKTCGDEVCQKQWHAKKCREWNKRNPAYFYEVYLSKKLSVMKESTADDHQPPTLIRRRSDPSLPLPATSSPLPRDLIQEVIGTQAIVIIEYMVRLLLNSFQEKTRRQLLEIKGEIDQLPPVFISRGDSHQGGP